MKIDSLILAGVITCSAALYAENKVEFSTDLGDYWAKVGSVCPVSVSVKSDNALVTNGVCKVTVDNFGPDVMLTTNVDLSVSNPFTIPVSSSVPGFVRIKADGTYFGVPFEPERIAPAVSKPADFESFWQDAIAKAERDIPLDLKLTKVDEKSNSAYDYYRISVATTNGRRVHGYLSVPTGAAKGRRYPVNFSIPGAGCALWSNRMGASATDINLFLTVFAFEPSIDDAHYPDVKKLYDEQEIAVQKKYGCRRYCQSGLAVSREEGFYYPVIIGAVRTLRWLCSQQYVDRDNVRYSGTSQGGGMGLAVTALSGCITRASIFVPAITGMLDYKAGRQSGWPQPVQNSRPEDEEAINRIAPYFDGVNFATMITCPIRFGVGMADQTCAPHAVYSAYNVCASKDKAIVRGVGMGHGVYGWMYERFGNWGAKRFPETVKHWKGARVGFLGDSITDPRHIGTKRNYWQDLGDWLELDYSSFGQNGCQIPAIAAQAQRAFNRYGDNLDALFVFCGTNDFNASVPMGEWYDEMEKTTNCDGVDTVLKYREFIYGNNTFRSRLNTMMRELKAKYPRQQIILMTPIHRGYAIFGAKNVQPPETYANKAGLYIGDYVAAVKEAGAIWSVPVIDLYADSGLYPVDPVYARFFSNAERDMLHPNAEGHRRLAKTIYYALSTLPVNFKNW